MASASLLTLPAPALPRPCLLPGLCWEGSFEHGGGLPASCSSARGGIGGSWWSIGRTPGASTARPPPARGGPAPRTTREQKPRTAMRHRRPPRATDGHRAPRTATARHGRPSRATDGHRAPQTAKTLSSRLASSLGPADPRSRPSARVRARARLTRMHGRRQVAARARARSGEGADGLHCTAGALHSRCARQRTHLPVAVLFFCFLCAHGLRFFMNQR